MIFDSFCCYRDTDQFVYIFSYHASKHKPMCTTEINSADDQNTIVNIVNTVNCCSYILICSLTKLFVFNYLCFCHDTDQFGYIYSYYWYIWAHCVELMIIKTNCEWTLCSVYDNVLIIIRVHFRHIHSIVPRCMCDKNKKINLYQLISVMATTWI